MSSLIKCFLKMCLLQGKLSYCTLISGNVCITVCTHTVFYLSKAKYYFQFGTCTGPIKKKEKSYVVSMEISSRRILYYQGKIQGYTKKYSLYLQCFNRGRIPVTWQVTPDRLKMTRAMDF